MKRPALLLLVILFFASCFSTERIKPSSNVFFEIDKTYPLSEYNIVVHTKDGDVNLSSPIVQQDGKLKAKDISEADKGKKMIFYSKKPTSEILERVLDSAGNKTDYFNLSKQSISKVKIYDPAKSSTQRTIYDKSAGGNNAASGFFLAVAIGVIAAVIIILIALNSIYDAIFNSGCYIATMVYGSYDAPEVLVLRKFRDEKLAPNFFGRLFIRTYYALSPSFVFIFKSNKPVNDLVRSILDRWVRKLALDQGLHATKEPLACLPVGRSPKGSFSF